MYECLRYWNKQAKKLEAGEITKGAYDDWRYNYPALDKSEHFVKVISEDVSNLLIRELTKTEKEIQKEKRKTRNNEHKNNLTDFHIYSKISKVFICHI